MLFLFFLLVQYFSFFFFLIRPPPTSTLSSSSAASSVYKRQFPAPQSNTVTATINGNQAQLYDYYDGSIWFYIDHYFATYKFNEVSFRYNEPVAGKSIDDFMLSIENWSQKPNDIITIEDIY